MQSFQKHFIHLGLGLVLTLELTGCAHKPHPPQAKRTIEQMLSSETGVVGSSLAERIMAEAPSRSKSRSRVESEIRRGIWWWMRYYSVRDRERFERILERGETYRPLVQQILGSHQLPPELYYLAMIESGYVNHARSSTAAVGIWQFMLPTALRFKLCVANGVDERRHPVSSTHAAARYLTYLHKRFDSWYLAIAAYNAGEGRIQKAINAGHSRDFWELADKGFLPQETMDYIPKFLAAATIGAHPSRFGFKDLGTPTIWPEVEEIQLKQEIKLAKVAEMARLSKAELIRFNPHLAGPSGHTRLRRVRIWVPKSSAKYFVSGRTTVASR